MIAFSPRLFTVTLLLGVVFVSQEVEATPYSSQEVAVDSVQFLDLSEIDPERRFDFLLGEWTYAFNQGEGRITYTEGLEGKTILENVNGDFAGTSFIGLSLITYDAESGGYQQKWIDTMGNVIQGVVSMQEYEASEYLALVSNFQLGERHFRHVWYNITDDRFETDLLISNDGGKTYQLARRMPYLRVK